MKCLFCEAEQPIGAACAVCEISMGKYYCAKCQLIDNDPKKSIYHCDECGICRGGKGLGIDMVHCKDCGCCMALNHKELGNCKPDLLKGTCPVCLEGLSESTKLVTRMPCKHPIHRECLQQVRDGGVFEHFPKELTPSSSSSSSSSSFRKALAI